MSSRYERRRKRVGCLGWLVALVWIVFLTLMAYQLFFRDEVSRFLGRQAGQQLRQGAQTQTERATGQPFQQGTEGALPTVIASLPAGEIRVSEAQANAYLATQVQSFKGIESATVRFVPGQVQADIKALGTTSTATMGLAVQDGNIIAVDPKIEGPLGQLVSASDLASTFTQQINAQLAAQGRRISDVRIEQGALIVEVEG